jgi:hypothetical protein
MTTIDLHGVPFLTTEANGTSDQLEIDLPEVH